MSYIKEINLPNNVGGLIEPILYGTSSSLDENNNNIIITDISNFDLVTGVVITLKITSSINTGTQLKINENGEVKNIQYNNENIKTGFLLPNHFYSLLYDGIAWQLIGTITINEVLDYNYEYFPNGFTNLGEVAHLENNAIYKKNNDSNEKYAEPGDLVYFQKDENDTSSFSTGWYACYEENNVKKWLQLIPKSIGQSSKLITERTLYYYEGNENISKLGTITNGTWNAHTIDVAHGGTGQTSFPNNAILYGNGSGAIQAEVPSWGKNWIWENSNTTGPAINLNLGGDSYPLPEIPVASENQSGVITTGAQTIEGVKTLLSGQLNFKVKNSNVNKIIFGTPLISNSDYSVEGVDEWASINIRMPSGESNNSVKTQFSFKQYSPQITNSNNQLIYNVRTNYEEYLLPEVTAELQSNKTYTILTSKGTLNGALYAEANDAEPRWGTLPVAQGGTGQTSFTTNSVLYGNATSGLGSINSADGVLYSTSANGTLSWGTLPVAQGGTGQTSFTENAILYGNGSGAIQSIAPAWQAWVTGTAEGPQAKIQIGNIDYTSGAIPSASTNASGIVTTSTQSFAGNKTFTGTIYINNNTSASSKTTGALVVDGGAGFGGTVYANAFNGPLTGNVTGNISGYSGTGTRTRTSLVKGTNPGETTWQSLWYNWQSTGSAITDRVAGGIESYVNASGVSAICLRAYQFASGSSTTNSMEIKIAKDGTCSYALSSPEAFKAALTLGTAAMDVEIGNYSGVTQHWGIGAIVQATSKGTKAYLGKRTSLVTTDTGCFLYNNTDGATIWSCVPDNYVLKSGSTMTGTLTLKASTYYAAGGGINANNADIIGVNGIFTADAATSFGEGINFYRSATPTWDSLVAKEGTFYFGSNNASSALVGNATLSCGTLILNQPSVTINTSSNNGNTGSSTIYKGISVWDSASYWYGQFYTGVTTGGLTYTYLESRNKKTDGTAVSNTLQIGVKKDGTRYYYVSDAAAFRSAIGAGTSSLTLGTSSTTAMAGNTNVTQVRQGASASGKWRKILLGATEYAAYNTDVGSSIDGNAFMSKSVAVQPSTGELQATGFIGPLTGNVTGNCSGTAGAVAWGNVTGKPSTFAPTIGTTATTAAAGNHTHSYLPLSGGTLTGNITISPTSTTVSGATVSITGGKTNNSSSSDDNYNYNGYNGTWTRIYLQNRYKATKKSDSSVTWYSSRIYFRQWSATANSGTHLDYYEQYFLPTCTDGKTANSSYSILTTKSAVTVAQGGTGATTAAGAKTNLGFRHGTVTASDGGGIVVSKGSVVSKTVSWSATPTVPTVVVGFATDSDAATFGNCCCSVIPESITTTGCTIKIFNGDTVQRKPKIAWIAIG